VSDEKNKGGGPLIKEESYSARMTLRLVRIGEVTL
jgi:hypothetical protein